MGYSYKTLTLVAASCSLIWAFPVIDPALSAPSGELALANAAPKTNAIEAAAANVDRSGWTGKAETSSTVG